MNSNSTTSFPVYTAVNVFDAAFGEVIELGLSVFHAAFAIADCQGQPDEIERATKRCWQFRLWILVYNVFVGASFMPKRLEEHPT